MRCTPRRVVLPADEQAVAAVLVEARGNDLPIRLVGSGHSYSPLVATTGTILSLDRLAGILGVDAGAKRAVIAAGTRLHTLGVPLRARGLIAPTARPRRGVDAAGLLNPAL